MTKKESTVAEKKELQARAKAWEERTEEEKEMLFPLCLEKEEIETDRKLTAEEFARIRTWSPDITYEKANEIEARFPFYTRGFPGAIFTWVNHEVEHNKELTDGKRQGLLHDLNGLKYAIERLDHLGREERYFFAAIMYAYRLGTACPNPWERRRTITKARNARVREWHSEARVRAAKMQDYPEEITAVSKRIYNKLKDKPVGPPSWDAVRQVLRRDLAKKRKSKKQDD